MEFLKHSPCKNSSLLTYLQGILPNDLLGIKRVLNGVRQLAGLPRSRKRLPHLSQSDWNCSLNRDVKSYAHLIYSLGRSEMSHWSWFELRKRKQLCSARAGLIVPHPELALVLLEGDTEL